MFICICVRICVSLYVFMYIFAYVCVLVRMYKQGDPAFTGNTVQDLPRLRESAKNTRR